MNIYLAAALTAAFLVVAWQVMKPYYKYWRIAVQAKKLMVNCEDADGFMVRLGGPDLEAISLDEALVVLNELSGLIGTQQKHPVIAAAVPPHRPMVLVNDPALLACNSGLRVHRVTAKLVDQRLCPLLG